MYTFRNEEKFWPSELQRLLLQACLSEKREALAAWEKWIVEADIDHLDQGSFRLIPLLYKRLRKFGVRKKILNLFAGIYRMSWYKNRVLLYNASQVIQSLSDKGIPSMLLKGGALSILYYKDYAVRPTWDIDLMVRIDEVLEVHELLKKSGWLPVPLNNPVHEHLKYRHAALYRNADGKELDLHWHILRECSSKIADEDFWNHAQKIELHQTPVYVLGAADQLFHVLIHGAQWSTVPTFRWVPDAMVIIDNDGCAVSWNRLIKLAKMHYLLENIRETLSFLKDNFDANIPDDILTELYKTKPTRFEQIEFKYRSQKPKVRLLGININHLLVYYRQLNGLGWHKKILHFPDYMANIYGLKNKKQLPLYLMRRGFKKYLKKTDLKY